MRGSAELERRLMEWAGEFAGSPYENVGYPSQTWLHKAIVYKGPPPRSGQRVASSAATPADEVEAAVVALERQEAGYRAAWALRAEYWMKGAEEATKLGALRRIGVAMGRTVYYDQLWIARVHVAAWLKIPASVELPLRAA